MTPIARSLLMLIISISAFLSAPVAAPALEMFGQSAASKALSEFASQQNGEQAKLVSSNAGPVGVLFAVLPATALSTGDAFAGQFTAMARSMNRHNEQDAMAFGIQQEGRIVASVLVAIDESYRLVGPDIFKAACSAADYIAKTQEWSADPRYVCSLQNAAMPNRIGGVIGVDGLEGYFVTTRYDMPTPTSPDAVDDDAVLAYLKSPKRLGLSNGRPYSIKELTGIVVGGQQPQKARQRGKREGDESGGRVRGTAFNRYLMIAVSLVLLVSVAGSVVVIKKRLSGLEGRDSSELGSLVAGLESHADQEKDERDEGDGASAGEPEVERENEPGKD